MFQFLLEMITGPVRKLFIPTNHLLPSCPLFLRSMARGSHYEVIIGKKAFNKKDGSCPHEEISVDFMRIYWMVSAKNTLTCLKNNTAYIYIYMLTDDWCWQLTYIYMLTDAWCWQLIYIYVDWWLMLTVDWWAPILYKLGSTVFTKSYII